MVRLLNFKGRPSTFWDKDIDFHVYEKRERAIGPKPGGVFNGFHGDQVEFNMRIAKAKALDKAREELIRAAQKAEQQTFPITFSEEQVSRTVDGAKGVTADDIKL